MKLSSSLLFVCAVSFATSIGCAAAVDGAQEDDDSNVVAESDDALVAGAVAAARAACTKKWAGNAICSTIFIEGGKKILFMFTSGRVCEKRGTEYLINSSNGSVTGTRSKCLKWR